MKILGIETSCDETAASVIEGSGDKIKVLSNIVSSQIDIHRKYGGVVPEVAAREHVLNIVPVVNEALIKAGIKRKDAPRKINAIAVTQGPGLITSLLAGLEAARALAYVWRLPLIPINHIEGHIAANFIDNSRVSKIKFPIIALTVSGGHTSLVLMKKIGSYKVVGETRDDAAGEAFDKAAKLLEVGYPGGPIIATKATIYNPQSTIHNLDLPRPMINSNNLEFSFSGLKTALLYAIKKDSSYKQRIPEYCYEFQQAIIETIISKTIKAAKKFEAKTIMLAGGVAANLELRRQLEEKIKAVLPGVTYLQPNLEYTTDNAAMIATAGYFHARKKKFTPWQKIKTNCNLEL